MSFQIFCCDVLSIKELKAIKNHEYSSTGKSVLDPYFQHFWKAAVECSPRWMAPNLLTLLGLVINAISLIPLIYYCPTFTEEAPAWTFFLFAVSVFVYQTLDAMDGKQARRLNMSTPLGELFDHGCDALTTVIYLMGYCVALRLGIHADIAFFMFMLAVFCYYLAHWQTYCTGSLLVGAFDVTEVQIVFIGILVITGLCSQEFWSMQISLFNGMSLRVLSPIMSTLACITSITNNFNTIFILGGCGKNGSTVAGTSVLSPAKAITTSIFISLLIYKKSPDNIFEAYTSFFFIVFGFFFAKITTVLIVGHMCKTDLHVTDTAFASPLLLFMNQYFNCPIPEFYVLVLSGIISFSDWLMYVVKVIIQISTYLDVPILTVRHQQ